MITTIKWQKIISDYKRVLRNWNKQNSLDKKDAG